MAQNQDNVSNMSIRRLLFQWPNTIEFLLSVLGPGLKFTIYHNRDEHAPHYTTDVVYK
jgi:hypothetical protein